MAIYHSGWKKCSTFQREKKVVNVCVIVWIRDRSDGRLDSIAVHHISSRFLKYRQSWFASLGCFFLTLPLQFPNLCGLLVPHIWRWNLQPIAIYSFRSGTEQQFDLAFSGFEKLSAAYTHFYFPINYLTRNTLFSIGAWGITQTSGRLRKRPIKIFAAHCIRPFF